MKPQQTEDEFFPYMGSHSSAQMEMLNSMRTLFSVFGTIFIVVGVVSIIIATILFIKDKKSNQKK